ncbi:MAG: hypothetical protein ACRDNZ_24030 [Streptosporangiaceae bacterium]
MSPNKTLYIREEDQDAWDRADAAAHATRQSLSQYVTGLIRRYAPEAPAAGEELQKITVEVGDTHRMWTEGFTGRWLAWREAPTGEWKRGIAVTKGGQFAWYEAVPEASDGDLSVYPSLDDLEAAVREQDWPDAEMTDNEHQLAGLAEFRAMVVQAAEAIGQEHVFWRDI